jgi:hypothetical protein
VLWLDGLVLKVRQGKQVMNKSAHIVLGLNLRGEKEVLGLWLAETEGGEVLVGRAERAQDARACATSTWPAWMASRACPRP